MRIVHKHILPLALGSVVRSFAGGGFLDPFDTCAIVDVEGIWISFAAFSTSFLDRANLTVVTRLSTLVMALSKVVQTVQPATTTVIHNGVRMNMMAKNLHQCDKSVAVRR